MQTCEISYQIENQLIPLVIFSFSKHQLMNKITSVTFGKTENYINISCENCKISTQYIIDSGLTVHLDMYITMFPGCSCKFTEFQKETLEMIRNIPLFKNIFRGSMNHLDVISCPDDCFEILSEILRKLNSVVMIFPCITAGIDYSYIGSGIYICETIFDEIVENANNYYAKAGPIIHLVEPEEIENMPDSTFIYKITLSNGELIKISRCLDSLSHQDIDWYVIRKIK